MGFRASSAQAPNPNPNPNQGVKQGRELAEAGAVIVPEGLGTAKGLGDGLRAVNALLKVVGRVRDGPEVLEHEARTLGLPCSRLAADNNRLVQATANHVAVGSARHGEDVGRLLIDRHARFVPLETRLVVQRAYVLVRVNGDQNATVLRVDLLVMEARLQSFHHIGRVDAVEGCQVFGHGVHLARERRGEHGSGAGSLAALRCLPWGGHFHFFSGRRATVTSVS